MNQATATSHVSLGRRVSRFMSDQPLVPLIILLAALVVVLQVLRPGIVNERWIANTVRFAIPLAILAGCQTMTMLTGGIDLSVGTVATMGAFIMVTQAALHDPAIAIPLKASIPLWILCSVASVVLFLGTDLLTTLIASFTTTLLVSL